jgi:hypothetical protein
MRRIPGRGSPRARPLRQAYSITIEIYQEAPLAVVGYKRPEVVLAIIRKCYLAATEHLLEAVAVKLSRTMKPGECIRQIIPHR